MTEAGSENRPARVVGARVARGGKAARAQKEKKMAAERSPRGSRESEGEARHVEERQSASRCDAGAGRVSAL